MTPQQATERKSCPFCAKARGHADDCYFHLVGIGAEGWAIETAWNNRAPAPPKPAVDRDAVLEEAARLVEDFQADKGTPTFNDIAHAIRALATPASPAVPAPMQKLDYTNYSAPVTMSNSADLPQASQPTSAEGKDGEQGVAK